MKDIMRMNEHKCPFGLTNDPGMYEYLPCLGSICAWYVDSKQACALNVIAEKFIDVKIYGGNDE